MIGWLNDINRLVSKDKREPRVIPAENTHTLTLALNYNVSAQAAYLLHVLKISMLETFLSFSGSVKLPAFIKLLEPIIESLQIIHFWQEKTQCWLLRLHQIAPFFNMCLSALKMSPAVMTAQL